jgi:signal transduction histidine kinase
MRCREAEVPGGGAAQAPASTPGLGDRLARFLVSRFPLGPLVRWVAGIRASVHAKLLGAFLLVTLLFIGMGAVSLQIMAGISRQSELLDQAHARVDSSRQIEHALAMQMNFTGMALLLKDEATIASILRENNRFNNTLARIEAAAAPAERATIQRIRAAQDQVLDIVADIANLIRDGRLADAMSLQLDKGYPVYRQIATLVTQVVQTEEREMEQLRQSVAAAHRRGLLLMGSFAGASIVLALLLGFVISWSFILPVREAEGFLAQVAKGNFRARVSVPNRDEFGVLVAHMNDMSRQLDRLYDDQHQAARELRALNEQLQRASRAKSDFLANMSHELRTPLNAILGFTEMILDGVYGDPPPALKETVTDVHTCGKQLLGLINEVLDLAKIEAGRMELSLADYVVEDVVNTVRLSLRSLAAEKGLDFAAATQPGIPPAFGDGKRITQCLTNLAGNALKFTREGRVEIWAECQGDALLFRVSDTGIGIPGDQIENIFTEFRQVDATIAQEFGGTGLGLSITKKFVEMHGGRIWVESTVGKGSTFFFTIPLRASAGSAA